MADNLITWSLADKNIHTNRTSEHQGYQTKFISSKTVRFIAQGQKRQVGTLQYRRVDFFSKSLILYRKYALKSTSVKYLFQIYFHTK